MRTTVKILLATMLTIAPAVAQCAPTETLAQAVAGVFGAGTTAAGLTTDDLVGVSDPDLERLWLAAPPADLADLLGLDAPRNDLAPGPGYNTVVGRLAFRAPATTPGAACAGMWLQSSTGDLAMKAWHAASFFDGCPSLHLSYDIAPNTPVRRRHRDEVRRINATTMLGLALTDTDRDADGNPIAPTPAALQRFFSIDLRTPLAWQDVPSLGWPWAGPVPAAGAPPAGWTPAFVVDPVEYPFASKVIGLRHGDVHYVDVAPSSPTGCVLLLHGNPTWSFLYRHVMTDLIADGFRVVAPDLYGFGLSDRPTTFGYRPRDHADMIDDFVQALDLQGVTLVVHDWSGGIGLGVAARLPSRIESLVIQNTWTWNMDPANPGVYHWMVSWSQFNAASSAMLTATGQVPASVANQIALVNAPTGTPTWQAVRDAYLGPFFDLATLMPLSAAHIAPTNDFAIEILLDREFLNDVDRGLDALIDLPVYFVWGGADIAQGALTCDPAPGNPCPPGTTCTTIGPQTYCLDAQGDFVYPYVERLVARWNPSRIAGVTIDPVASHFVAEHAPQTVADAVRFVHAFRVAGCSNASDWPRLAATQPEVGQPWILSIEAAGPSLNGWVFASAPASSPTVLGGGCLWNLIVGASLTAATVTTDASGHWSTTLQVPAIPALAGLPLDIQGALVTAGGPALGILDLTSGMAYVIR